MIGSQDLLLLLGIAIVVFGAEAFAQEGNSVMTTGHRWIVELLVSALMLRLGA